MYSLVQYMSIYDLSGGGAVTFTECTHIIDKPIHVGIGPIEDMESSVEIWNLLKVFGREDLFKFRKLSGDGIHRLESILTMTPQYREAFHRLWLWSDPEVSYRLIAFIYYINTALQKMTPMIIPTDTV
ncbi:hypothetical protein BC629DRAFT_894908 [Irpex lacteus]|nr:hypothetical protein BC629DRAFT_894908 [Irpex lacteus]